MKLRYLLSLSLVGVLLLGACGGDDDDNSSGDDNGTQATTTSTSPSDATKASEQPTTAAQTPKAGATSASNSALSDFQKLAGDALKKSYQVTYDVELSLNGQVQNGTATYANKPPKFAAIVAITAAGAAGNIKLSVIADGTDTYVCTDFGIGGSCSKDNGSEGPAAGLDIQKSLEDATSGKNVTEVDKRTIAGRSARCFETTDPTDPTSKSTYCIDSKDSIMLAFETGGGLKMTAKDVKTSVDDKLFELPFPVN
ncbi:MAG: hypothetical protein AB7N24_05105 [Dehalococcoidia bacterium]